MSDSVRPHRRQPTRLPRPWDSPGRNTGVGCHFPLQCMKAESESEVTQSCPTLRDPMDCSPLGSSVHRIFQAEYWSGVPFPSPKQLQSTSQSQTCTKKRSCSLFGGLLPIWSTTLSESWWNHYIWEVCSANWRDAMKTAMPEASTGQQNGPNCTGHNQRFKSWTKWATKFCLICHIHYVTSCQPKTTSSSISTFCRENTSTTSRRQKMLSKSSLNPETRIFTLQE